MKTLLRLIVFGVSWSFLLLATAADAAEPYPSKPIRFIVPFPPGGGTDILARLVGEELVKRLGEQIVVDNRPGAGTNIGMGIAASARPDGYTLLMASVGVAANPSLYRRMPFNPAKDLAPVTLVAIAPSVLVVHPSVPAKTPKELVALLKAQPGRLNYGSFGSGSGGHLAAELFKLVTHTDIVHIPYKGGGPAIRALLAGEVQIVFSSQLPVLGYIKTGRMRAIGLAADKRSVALPDVPTFRESGIDYKTGTWWGVLVPAGTPSAIIDRLNREITAILRTASVHQRIVAQGGEPVGSSPAEFAAFIKSEARKFAKVVKAANIHVE